MLNLKFTGLIYLASPYTDQSESVERERHKAVACAASALIRKGYRIYSPIVHALGLNAWTEQYKLWADWAEYDEAFILAMPGFAILTLQGWQQSVGVTAEHKIAYANNKERFLIIPRDADDYWVLPITSIPPTWNDEPQIPRF